MRRLLILLAAVAFCTTGCVQVHMDTTIEKDGTGLMSMSYAMSAAVAEAMAELGELPQQGDEQAPMLDDFDEDKFKKACKRHGCELKSFEKDDTKMSLAIAFESLENLSKALADGNAGGDGGFGLFKTEDGNYTVSTIEYEPVVDEEAEEDVEAAVEQEFDPDAMGKSMEVMGKLMGSIGELEFSMRITVPGDIISHNAHRVEGRTVIWEIDSSNMMTAGQDMQEPDVVFSGKGLKIDAPAL